jgi:rhamnulokinase
MSATVNFLAIDLGASGGRVLLGGWDGPLMNLTEVHRFANQPVVVHNRCHWDVLRLWHEIVIGIAHCADRHTRSLISLGVDTWGVDFALLDKSGKLLGNPRHYRDSRTDGMMERAFAKIPRRNIFVRTGNQFMQFNTLFQLFSMAAGNDPQLRAADTLLWMPDLFHYWMTGRRAAEFTIATTSQMYDIRQRCWAADVLANLQIPSGILPAVVDPGTILGQLPRALQMETHLSNPPQVVTPASHDTSSAIAAIPGLDDSSVFISSGTWSLMGLELPEPVVNGRVMALNYTNEGGVGNAVNLLKILTGLWLLQACRKQWTCEGQDYDWPRLIALGAQALPFQCLVDPDAVDFLNPPDMCAAIRQYCRKSGQPQPETEGAIVRCCLESLALNYRKTLEELERLTGRHLQTIRIVGGGSRNELLSQFTADACRRPVVTGPVEATALGNIVIQAVATGHIDDIKSGRDIIAASCSRKEYLPAPQPEWEAAYRRFLKVKENN